MGFTGNVPSAGSDDSPYIYMELFDGEVGHAKCPDNPGDDMTPNDGDLWKIPIFAFNFKKSCIRKGVIDKVYMQEGGNDGWFVASIFTAVNSTSGYRLLTADVDVNRWIDGNGSADQKQLVLTIQY